MIKYIQTLALVFCTTTAVADTSTADAQLMLNRLGFAAGAVDGAYGRNTRAAIDSFYQSIGGTFDGSLDANELQDLTAAVALLPELRTYKNFTLEQLELEGLDIPLIASRFYNLRPSGGTMKGFRTLLPDSAWVGVMSDYDFDGDGIRDKIFAAATVPDNHYLWGNGVSDDERRRTGWCEGECRNAYSLPMFFKGLGNNEFQYIPGAIRDSRATPGLASPHRLQPADFNADGVLDFIISDHGWDHSDAYNGDRTSYYLSQPDGTWLESSATHVNNGREFKNFNHGINVGDIDGDGDIDIIETTISRQSQGSVWCRLNDGTGHMTIRACSSSNLQGWGLAVSDLDKDGCNDIAVVGTPSAYGSNYSGVLWGNCTGNFRGARSALPDLGTSRNRPDNWSETIAVWTADLDGDGDSDIIASNVGTLYVGAALHFIENLGNRQFKSRALLVYNEPPATSEGVRNCHRETEANACNGYVLNLHLRDVNSDGKIDLMMIGQDKYTNTVYTNMGNFNFSQGSGGQTARHLQ